MKDEKKIPWNNRRVLIIPCHWYSWIRRCACVVACAIRYATMFIFTLMKMSKLPCVLLFLVLMVIYINALTSAEMKTQANYYRAGLEAGTYYKWLWKEHGIKDRLTDSENIEPSVYLHNRIKAYSRMLKKLNKRLRQARRISTELFEDLSRTMSPQKFDWEYQLSLIQKIFLPSFLQGVYESAGEFGDEAVKMHTLSLKEANEFFYFYKLTIGKKRDVDLEYN